MNGKEARLRRLFHHLEGRLLIVPLDHSVSDGPITGNEEYESLIKDITSCGADAIVVHKGRLKQLPAQAFVNSSIIVQLSASTRYARDPNEKVLVCSVEDALMRGADGITVHVNVGSNSEPEQLEDIARIADVCDRLGVPLLAMMYARGPGIEEAPRLQAIAHAGSLAADLGADLAKLALPADVDDVHWIVSRCPLPVVASGGPKTDESEFLRYAEAVIQGGAIGLAVGRNVFQSKHPGGLVANLRRRIDGASTRGPSSTTREAVAAAG
jgi:2-amino-4,5-dihydroxy-6-oxo-7-(phosphonooxy)heptanoate synthase